MTCAAILCAIAAFAAIGSSAAPAAAARIETIVALGDSITSGVELADPRQAYPYLIGTHLHASVRNLALGGAASGVNTYGDVRRSQLEDVMQPCDLAILSVGTNDITLMSAGYYTFDDYVRNVRAILETLHAECGRVVVTTVIDNSWNTLAAGRDRKIWSTAVAEENAFIASLPDVVVVDLNADARLHDRASFVAPRLLHPSVAGHIAIAEDIEASLER